MQVNVAGLRRNIKNLAHNYSDAQVKVREATSNDPWGPSATIMAEIADLTYNVVAFSEIMQMIWKRLNDHGRNWRHVYKALILLEYLIKTGSEKVAQQCKENIFAIQTLREFVYFEEGKDQGTHVREKAKQLAILLRDDERLKNERIKALKAKERFSQHPSGFGSDGYIDGPSQRDMPPGWQEEPKPVSELEMVRPQTAGEEELQLQLAMAMSREEAEQEEAKRRSDDVRLQLALSQSEQDFKEQKVGPNEKKEPQSHLLDLLDISLGATSISSPPPLGAGAVGGLPTDPWGTPARAVSQISDPWSGTSSPQIDPWQPTAATRHVVAPLSSVPGTSDGEAWALRTQSPSVVSGSSGEGWLHNTGVNGNPNIGVSMSEPSALGLDPWLSKNTNNGISNAPPLAAPTNYLVDPWLANKTENNALAKPSPGLVDPWKLNLTEVIEDPWKALENAGNKKISPELDEFDIISNRNKTAEDHATNNKNDSTPKNNNININNNNNISNNAASLLDEMDPLAPCHAVNTSILSNGKKQLKNPQAFLGENSALVNLDNLIKPVPQTQVGNSAYNPFSDTIVTQKTNLFQQQQPAVPSINQLKQQQPFAMTINQDPWAPVPKSTNSTLQSTRNKFLVCDSIDEDQRTICIEAIVHNTNKNYNDDREIFELTTQEKSNIIQMYNKNHSFGYNNMQLSTTNCYDKNTNFDYMHSKDVEKMDYMNLRDYAGTYDFSNSYNLNLTPFNHHNNFHNNNNDFNINHNYFGFAATRSNDHINAFSANSGVPNRSVIEEAVGVGNGTHLCFSGYYNSNRQLEQNNNNMPWMNPEAATSNPFLS